MIPTIISIRRDYVLHLEFPTVNYTFKHIHHSENVIWLNEIAYKIDNFKGKFVTERLYMYSLVYGLCMHSKFLHLKI